MGKNRKKGFKGNPLAFKKQADTPGVAAEDNVTDDVTDNVTDDVTEESTEEAKGDGTEESTEEAKGKGTEESTEAAKGKGKGDKQNNSKAKNTKDTNPKPHRGAGRNTRVLYTDKKGRTHSVEIPTVDVEEFMKNQEKANDNR